MTIHSFGFVAGSHAVASGPLAASFDASAYLTWPAAVVASICFILGYLQDNPNFLEGTVRFNTSDATITATGDGARAYGPGSQSFENCDVTIHSTDLQISKEYLDERFEQLKAMIEQRDESDGALEELTNAKQNLESAREEINRQAKAGDKDANEAIRKATKENNLTSLFLLLDRELFQPYRPKDTSLRRQIAAVSLASGDFDIAIPELKQVLTAEPSDLRGWTELVRAYLIQGKLKEAEAILEHLSQSDDKQLQAIASHNLGIIAFERRELDKAEEYFNRSLELDPESNDELTCPLQKSPGL